jgi:tetratricopeptide (TPR) repeat protein
MNLYPGAFTLLWALTAQSPPGDEFVNGASRKVVEAEAALAEGVPEKVLALLESLGKDPSWDQAPKDLQARGWRALGLAGELGHDPEAAVSALKTASELARGSSASLAQDIALALARAGLEMKDAGLARATLERLDKGELSQPPAALLLGLSFFVSDDTRQAEKALLDVLHGGMGPGNPAAANEREVAQAAFYLGVIFFDRGDREAALKNFELAAKLDPQDYYVHVYMARSLLDLDRGGEALKRLEGLVAPFQTPEVRSLEGRAQLRERRYEEATALFRQALEMNPRSTEALMGLGTALRCLGKQEEARRALERFQALHQEESEHQRKVNALSQAIERSPKDSKAVEEMALLAFEGGDVEAAERNAWRALILDPRRIPSRLILARALARGGRYGAASVQYQKILRQDPNQEEARQELDELVRNHARKRP